MAKFISFPIFSSFIVIHLPKCYFSLCMEESLVYLGNCRPGHGPAPACRVPRTADWLPAAGLEPPEPRPAAARQHEAIKCGDCGGTLFRISFCSHNHHIAVHQFTLPPAWTSLPPPAILRLGKWCLLCEIGSNTGKNDPLSRQFNLIWSIWSIEPLTSHDGARLNADFRIQDHPCLCHRGGLS